MSSTPMLLRPEASQVVDWKSIDDGFRATSDQSVTSSVMVGFAKLHQRIAEGDIPEVTVDLDSLPEPSQQDIADYNAVMRSWED